MATKKCSSLEVIYKEISGGSILLHGGVYLMGNANI